MTAKRAVPTDEQLGKFARRLHDWFERACKGSLDIDAVTRAVHGVIDKYILRIDRSTLFNPVKFIGEGLSIWRGPADGDGLSGDKNQDERSIALTELDLSKVQLTTCLRGKESHIGGEEKLLRLKESGRIRLDAGIFQTLWENKEKIPEIWKEKTDGNTTYIFFDGTILRGPGGRRCVLCIGWVDGEWRWDYHWLGFGWSSYGPSAVLAS